MAEEGSSALRLRAGLLASNGAMRVLQNDAQYHAQVAYTCQILGVVDQVVDQETAARITDAICDRLAGPRADEAVERIQQMQAELARLGASVMLR